MASVSFGGKCEAFVPQRFRPTFCKTCYKSKSEHPASPASPPRPDVTGPPPSPMQAAATRAAIPPPFTAAPPTEPAPLPPGVDARTKSVSIGPPLVKPLERRKSVGHTAIAAIDPNSPQPRLRKSSGRLARSVSIHDPKRISSRLKTGFLGKQQTKGELPNANRFLLNTLRELLSEGVGLSAQDTEDVMRRVAATRAMPDNPGEPILLLKPSKRHYVERLAENLDKFMEEQDTLHKVILVQSRVRSFLVYKKFDRMPEEEKTMLRKRNAVYIELVRTDRKFMGSMDRLIHDFMIPMRHNGVAEPHECANIFSNIEVLAEEHRQLYRSLQELGDTWPFIGNVGAIFLDLKGLFNAISVYVSNFKNAMNEVDRLTEENPRFNAFCAQQSADDVDLTTRLTMTINRIAQYEYYLRQLLDLTPEATKEHEDLSNAFAVLAQSSLVVQKSLVQSAETAQIHAIRRRLKSPHGGPLTLVKQGRCFLKEFAFRKDVIFLFNDLVILAKSPHQGKAFSTTSKGMKSKSKEVKPKEVKAKEGKPKSKEKGKEEPCKVRKMSELKKCVLNVTTEKLVELVMDDEVIRLQPSSPEVKAQFIIEFNSALDEMNRAKVFGVALADTVKRENRPDGIPLLVTKVINFLEENDLLTQAGIFRIAGSKTETVQLRDIFDQGGDAAAQVQMKLYNIHSLCDILKSYLRSLPEPLLSYSVYDPLVTVMKESEDITYRKSMIREQLGQHVPVTSLRVLHHLIQFLCKVSACSEENKMTTSNLSIVFGPTCLWPKENSLESAMDMPYVNSVVQLMIEDPSLIPSVN